MRWTIPRRGERCCRYCRFGKGGPSPIDHAITHPVNQVLPDALWKILPALNFGHQPPKTIRPSWSPRRLAASGLLSLRKRSARSKNSCCFRLSASMPFSINSTSIRVALSLLDFAIVRTCDATLAGRLTLWRTVFGSATLISPLCTSLMRMDKLGLLPLRSREAARRFLHAIAAAPWVAS